MTQDLENQEEQKQVLSEETTQLIPTEETGKPEDLAKCLKEILRVFSKNISDEALYANIPTKVSGDITVEDLFTICKKLGITPEMRRINILDIKSGPCILVLSNKRYQALIDEKVVYNPKNEQEEEFLPKELIKDYTGYGIFFYEENLTISTFLQKTSFLFNSLKNFKPTFIEVIVISFFINLFAVVAPLFTMNVYDRVIPNHAIPTLFVLSFGMILVYLFDLIFKVIKSYLTDYISLTIGSEVDEVLLKKLLSARAPGIAMSNGAKNSLFKELAMVREFYFSRFIPALVDLPFLILFFGLLLLISPIIAIVPLVASILIFVVNIMLQVPLQNTHATLLTQEQQKNAVLVETIMGTETYKTFNGIGKVLFKWKRALDASYRTSYNYNLWVNIAANFSVFVMNLVSIIVVIVGVFEISGGLMTTGGLIASTTIAARIMTTIIGFSSMVVRYRSVQNTLRHLEKVVNYPAEDDTENPGQKGPFKGDIKFKDVNFFYPGLKQPILHNCSFHIKSQDKIAIIGKTGAGKSTLTRILLGLDFTNSGQVFVDNIDINSIHINELRANIGFMPQKAFFFQGTVRENILMNNLHVSEEQYQKACRVAGVHLVTAISAKGDDMIVQEGGSNLSGGQQQIISLARAVLHDPPIIIMDEPTNGMDIALEASFMSNIKQYIQEKTFILITHKPSQLSLVDRVILIDNSTVVIDDTKEKVVELLSKGGKNKE